MDKVLSDAKYRGWIAIEYKDHEFMDAGKEEKLKINLSFLVLM